MKEKNVGDLATMNRVHASGVVLMECAAGTAGLETDVIETLEDPLDMNVLENLTLEPIEELAILVIADVVRAAFHGQSIKDRF